MSPAQFAEVESAVGLHKINNGIKLLVNEAPFGSPMESLRTA